MSPAGHGRRLRLTIRVRLTLLYGGLFFAAGVVLLGVTYVLMGQSLHQQRPFTSKVPGVVKSIQPRVKIPEQELTEVEVKAMLKQREALEKAEAAYQRDTLNSLLTQGGMALALVGAAAVGLGWLMADRALRPISNVTEAARRVARSHDLTERIAYEGPRDEVKELADTFDVMLARLARAFDGQRRFVTNASHELRTPLAINRTLVDVAVRRSDASDDVRRLGESLLVVNARHERLIDGLLTLASGENAVTDRTAVDLADVADHVLDMAAAEAAEHDLAVTRATGAAPTRGDPVLLERLVQNLVENAVRHNVPGGRIWVRTGHHGSHIEVAVANTGPAVPPYDIEAIFEPFRRLRAERVASDRGSGLGLSIVRAVAGAHGGAVRAQPRPGGGLVIALRLPAAEPPAKPPTEPATGPPTEPPTGPPTGPPTERATGPPAGRTGLDPADLALLEQA